MATTFEVALGSAGWQKLSLTESLPTGGPQGSATPPRPCTTSRTSSWDAITLSTTAAIDIPAPADHTSTDGLLRIRVAPGNTPAQLGTIDVSGQKSGAA